MSRNLSNIDKIFSRSESPDSEALVDYVRQDLGKEESWKIEAAMVDDPFLSDAVEGIEEIGAEDFTDLLAELDAELESRLDQPEGKEIPFVQAVPSAEVAAPNARRASGFRLGAIAAAIALLFLAGYFVIPKMSGGSFQQEHYLGLDFGDVRAEGDNASEFEKAGQLYKDGKYREAGKIFGQIDNDSAKLLAGHSYFNLKDYALAAKYFQEVIDLKKGNVDDAEYNLALSYVAMNKKDDARKLFEMIAADDFHNFHEQAAEALSDLGN